MSNPGSDERQSDLHRFTDGGDGGRDVEAEARAVAGSDTQRADTVVDADDWLPEPTGEVEMAVTQVDYTIEGSGDDEAPVMHVFGRTSDNELEHVRAFGFRPYFYAPTDSLDAPPEEEFDRLTGSETTDENGDPYESIRGERLTKIFGQTPRDVGNVRDHFDHYEADILFPNRFLIDKDINSGIRVPERRGEDGDLYVPHEEVVAAEVDADPRVNYFDIEVDDRSGFPEDGEERIVCLTSFDSYDDTYVAWLYDAPDGDAAVPENLSDYDPIEDADIDVEVRTFDDERAMLEAFLDYIDETDPDILTGWNCLPADSEIQMADGTEKEIQNVEIGDEIVGSEDQKTTTARVTNKWRSEKEVLEFGLADGTTLRSSEEHRIMVGDDETVDWKEGGEIEPGDYVLKPRKFRVESTTVPTMEELVPAEKQRFDDKEAISELKDELPYGAVTELSSEFDVSKEVLYHPETSVWDVERYVHASNQYDVPVPDGGTVYKRTGADLNRELTERELYLAGLVLTDGTMSTEYGIRFYNTRTELHEQFPGENALQPDGKGCYKQNVLDYATMYAFHGLGIPFGNKNDGEVDFSTVYQLPEKYIAQFLAGVIDGDGCISHNITVAAENRSIGRWYAKLFRRLGIYARQRGHKIEIPGSKREVGRLRETVLPHMCHSEKVERLETFEAGKSQQSENIPYALFEAETGTDAKRIGRDKHRRNINLKRHETDCEEWEEYVFVPVEQVEQTETETTYDIETTTHNFVAEDCLVHNCDDFDVPYLLDRIDTLQNAHEYDLDSQRLSRVNEVWRSDWGGPSVKGRVVFDLLYAYKRTQFSELESYRLDAVGETELGVGKERYPGDIGDLWEDDPERLLEYNLRDVEICVELDRKQDIVSFWEEVASFVGCKLEDATTPGDAVDVYVLHKAHGRFALPSKGQQESEDYEGGAVFEPITGVKENVTVLDLKSLYPMSMATINASPETKVDPDEYESREAFERATYRAPNGTHFRKDKDGIIREIIDETLTEREEKKSLRNERDPGTAEYERFDRQQAAVKVIMNSLYGVLGWERFRLYDKAMGAAITATGREVIEYTDEVATELGYEVAYGDTDSVMLELGHDVSKDEAIEQSFDIEERINAAYDDFARDELNVDIDGGEDHRFQIEFEKLYRRFFQAGTKKRYAGHIVWKEGKDVDDIDITGFEYKRSDIAPITKEVQKRVIEMIVHGEDLDDVKDYVHEVIEDFEKEEADLEKMGIPGGIGQRLSDYDTATAHIRGAKYANAILGTNFTRGSKPKRLYLEKVEPEFFERKERENPDLLSDPMYREFKRNPGVICFEFTDQIPDEFKIDYEKMLEKTLQGPIERILKALNISWEEAKGEDQQAGLDQYM
ncbi:DNA polymerase [Halorussus salilacus]|uniref:DNA polymerase domain-containing protein n=1 Tax=Halorussus salilacus TaxID=2953750 RepID=UPI00209F084F|nr:DNA polymerase domain-containing protein [Halorussus salilacus]USZ68867.1 DNA polymerase [Halorussus salilacus]